MKYMRRVIGLISLLLALSLSAMAQIFGATQQEEQQAFGASAPGAVFQSTSSMSGSGSTYSPNPGLNADGSATYQGASYAPAKAIRRPGGRRTEDTDGDGIDNETGLPVGGSGNGGEDTPDKSDTTPNPLGDAVLPLMLLLCAYAVYKVRARKEA